MSWIFGYGSLIWRPDFPYERKHKAVIRGWQRRFWQASPDHRGVPEAPGRVVTLVESPGKECWGVAFRAQSTFWEDTMERLDEREKNGYEAHTVPLELDDGTEVDALTYIAGPDNPSFVGPAAIEDMASQIAHAHGPSGSNREYLLELANELSALGIVDQEVHALCQALGADAR